MIPNVVIERVLDCCNGWIILDPELLKEDGLPAEYVDDLTTRLESDFSRCTSSIYVDGEPVDLLDGVYALDLLRKLAKSLNADFTGVTAIGRGAQADQLKKAILGAIAE